MRQMIGTKWVFIVCAVVSSGYQGAWFLWKVMGWHWDTVANIPGFAFLLLAWPWSLAGAHFQPELQEYIGEAPRHLVTVALTALGFAFNAALSYAILSGVARRLRTHNQ
ncbi:hypothetical protein FE845_17930 [Marinobacter sp. 1-4A]|uniref:hypothetical protein n=1 Tax=Marinobacter sp. 1-4A TaxID=2582919 RepID=UPI00190635F9|nr:hypothetical protein [Marinobacter sp. 1-4A]MBK1853230.1 hypothetical protein [Marinobacter sp. 1-4A]